MKKTILAVVAAFSLVSLSGCDYFTSPEKKAYDAFVKKCMKDPSGADCKAWRETQAEK